MVTCGVQVDVQVCVQVDFREPPDRRAHASAPRDPKDTRLEVDVFPLHGRSVAEAQTREGTIGTIGQSMGVLDGKSSPGGPARHSQEPALNQHGLRLDDPRLRCACLGTTVYFDLGPDLAAGTAGCRLTSSHPQLTTGGLFDATFSPARTYRDLGVLDRAWLWRWGARRFSQGSGVGLGPLSLRRARR
jgi:hypothetical protein